MYWLNYSYKTTDKISAIRGQIPARDLFASNICCEEVEEEIRLAPSQGNAATIFVVMCNILSDSYHAVFTITIDIGTHTPLPYAKVWISRDQARDLNEGEIFFYWFKGEVSVHFSTFPLYSMH